MSNIFEGAKFGDKFMTRDRRCATLRYLHIGNGVIDQAMLITPLHDILVDGDGKELCVPNIKTPHDIIGRWQEPINKEELDRIDIINMLRGTTPSYSVMKDIPKELGSYCGGFVDEWKWNISAYSIEYFKEYSDEYLLELYYKCKKGE